MVESIVSQVGEGSENPETELGLLLRCLIELKSL